MEQKRILSRWTQLAALSLLGGALAWTVKLAIIITTNGRIIDTGAAAVCMTTGLLLLATGSTGIGHRLTVNRSIWLHIPALVLSPVFCFAALYALNLLTGPLVQNSQVWYAQQEAPIGIAVLFFTIVGFLLFKNRYVPIRQNNQTIPAGFTSSALPAEKPKRRRGTILKWTGVTLLVLAGGLAVVTASRQHLTYEAPYPEIQASNDSSLIAKGKHIALVQKGCVHCHSPLNNIDSVLKRGEEPSLAGARRFETPFGTFFTPNLTPDAKTGIGSMSDREIARVLRYGVKQNGEAVLPFMQGLDMSDEEMTALLSYLRSQKPVQTQVPANEFSLMGRFAKAFLVKPVLPKEKAPLAKR